jgi:hypothetical protein
MKKDRIQGHHDESGCTQFGQMLVRQKLAMGRLVVGIMYELLPRPRFLTASFELHCICI